MATLEDLKYLFGGQNPNSTPWSSMAQANLPNASFDPSAGYNATPNPSDQAMPPMTQPSFNAAVPAPDQSGGGSSSVSGEFQNPQMLALYKQILSKSNEGIGEQKDYLQKLRDYSDKVKNTPLNPDYTALMMASDAWNGTHFQPQYKKPIDQMQKDQMGQQADLAVQNQLGNISKEELNSLKTQLGGVLQTQKFQEAGNNKMSDQDEKDRQALMKALDTEKSSGRFTPIGKAQGNLYQAQRVQALIDQYKSDPNAMPLTGPSSLSEIAIGLNSLLSATGGSEESRKSLIPTSARGKFSTLEQYLANRPTGADMGEFVKNAQDTLGREMKTNQGQVDKYREKIADSWGLGRYAKRHPEEFGKLVDTYTQAPAADMSTAPSNAPKVGDVLKGYKFLGGDPAKQESWSKQ